MNTPNTHTEAEHVRRKLAEAYKLEAANKRWKKNERAAFAFMAASWEKTVKMTLSK